MDGDTLCVEELEEVKGEEGVAAPTLGDTMGVAVAPS